MFYHIALKFNNSMKIIHYATFFALSTGMFTATLHAQTTSSDDAPRPQIIENQASQALLESTRQMTFYFSSIGRLALLQKLSDEGADVKKEDLPDFFSLKGFEMIQQIEACFGLWTRFYEPQIVMQGVQSIEYFDNHPTQRILVRKLMALGAKPKIEYLDFETIEMHLDTILQQTNITHLMNTIAARWGGSPGNQEAQQRLVHRLLKMGAQMTPAVAQIILAQKLGLYSWWDVQRSRALAQWTPEEFMANGPLLLQAEFNQIFLIKVLACMAPVKDEQSIHSFGVFLDWFKSKNPEVGYYSFQDWYNEYKDYSSANINTFFPKLLEFVDETMLLDSLLKMTWSDEVYTLISQIIGENSNFNLKAEDLRYASWINKKQLIDVLYPNILSLDEWLRFAVFSKPQNEEENQEQLSLVQKMVEAGADVNYVPKDEQPLSFENMSEELIEYLVSQGLELYGSEADDNNVFFYTITNSPKSFVKWLPYLSNPNMRAIENEGTLLHQYMLSFEHRVGSYECLDESWKNIFDILIDKGLDINALDENKMTVLHLAHLFKIQPIIDYLLEKGAYDSPLPKHTLSFIPFDFESKSLDIETLDALKAQGKILIGLATDQGLNYNEITKACKKRMRSDERLMMGWVTPAMLEGERLEYFSGIILPGASDSYPKHLHEFSKNEMPATEKIEQFYQSLLPRLDALGIPTLGICAGAQHLNLHRDGLVGPVKDSSDEDAPITMIAGTIPYFMALSPEEKAALLDDCIQPEVSFSGHRAHGYAAKEHGMGRGLRLGARSKLGTTMAYADGLSKIAFQFHPEGNYDSSTYSNSNFEAKKRATFILDTFFNTAIQDAEFMQFGAIKGFDRKKMIKLRDYLNNRDIIRRIQECADRPNAFVRIATGSEISKAPLTSDEYIIEHISDISPEDVRAQIVEHGHTSIQPGADKKQQKAKNYRH
jgi:gamma-glutamyl-gamma-aminobutyrate hydrolase PuuD